MTRSSQLNTFFKKKKKKSTSNCRIPFVSTSRESESSGQLKLIHQLEAGLRNQQQVIDTKDEVHVL